MAAQTTIRNFFISIDPGCVNNATVLIETCEGSMVHHHERMECMVPDGVDNLDLRARVSHSLNLSVALIKALLQERETAKITLLIEHQYIKPHIATLMLNIKLSLVENTFFNMAQDRFQLQVFCVNSSAYKKSLKIAKGEHAKNKKAALEFAHEHGYQTKSDHFADCWNQAYWYHKTF